MATNNPEALNKPMLFIGKQVYGVIILKKIISNFDFKATQKFHMVNDRERMRWWGEKPVYMYLFEFYPFKYPADYRKIPGIQTFVPHIDIINEETYDQPAEQTTGSEEVAPVQVEGQA
jgi:hypothetical protein